MTMEVRAEDVDGVRVLTIAREDKLNAMNRAGWEALRAAVERCRDPEVTAVVITGAGSRAFVAGADIEEMLPRAPLVALDGLPQAVVHAIADLPVVTVAALNGVALGGGFEIALACDFRVATPYARVGLPEVGLGLVPAAGGTQRLLAHVGLGMASEIILAGRTLEAHEALAVGLVSRVVAPDDLVPEALSLAREVARKGPVAVRLAKVLLAEAAGGRAGAELERVAYALSFFTDDRAEGMRAFLEGRRPDFNGS